MFEIVTLIHSKLKISRTDIGSITKYVLTFKPLACINQTTLEYDEPKIFQSRISFLACNIKTCCSLS